MLFTVGVGREVTLQRIQWGKMGLIMWVIWLVGWITGIMIQVHLAV